MPKRKKYKKQAERAFKKYPIAFLSVLLALIILFIVCYYTVDAFKIKVDKLYLAMTQTQTSDSDEHSGSEDSGTSDTAVDEGGILSKYSQYSEDFSYLDFNTNQPTEKCVKVHFIDIGQGDCIFIQLSDGKTVMIDSGDNSSSNEKVLHNYLTEKLNIGSIDYVIGTHQDSDHIGNFDYIYKNYSVGYTFLPYVHSNHSSLTSAPATLNPPTNGGKASTSKTYADFLLGVLNEGTPYSFFNYNSDFGNSEEGYFFDFLTPTKEVASIKYTDSNDYSPIIKFSYSDFDILFTGDAEKTAIEEYLAEYEQSNIDIDLLKVGHHGSYTSTTKELLDKVNPEYAVIQVGLNNKYKHPRQEVLDLLFENDATKIFRNDLHGDIVLTINSDGTFFIDVEKTDVPFGRALTGISA